MTHIRPDFAEPAAHVACRLRDPQRSHPRKRKEYNPPHPMRRPIRTRRLSIAAIASLLAFVIVTAAEVRSFWNWDEWDFGGYVLSVSLKSGCVHAVHVSNSQSTISLRHGGHQSGDVAPEDRNFGQALTGFGAQRNILSLRAGDETIQKFDLPLWPLLLLLLIAPVRWLIAQPANAPAFPVITDAKRSRYPL